MRLRPAGVAAVDSCRRCWRRRGRARPASHQTQRECVALKFLRPLEDRLRPPLLYDVSGRLARWPTRTGLHGNAETIERATPADHTALVTDGARISWSRIGGRVRAVSHDALVCAGEAKCGGCRRTAGGDGRT